MKSRSAPEGGLHVLIRPLCLPVCLGVIPGGETDGGANALTESLPDLGGELGATVTDDVGWESVKAINVLHKQLSCLL